MTETNWNNPGQASAASLLVRAYGNAEANGGSVSLSEIDEAYKAAVRELARNAVAQEAQQAHESLAEWLIFNLLNESQLNVTPPGYSKALRYFTPSGRVESRWADGGEGYWNESGDVFTAPIDIAEWGAKIECHGASQAEAEFLRRRVLGELALAASDQNDHGERSTQGDKAQGSDAEPADMGLAQPGSQSAQFSTPDCPACGCVRDGQCLCHSTENKVSIDVESEEITELENFGITLSDRLVESVAHVAAQLAAVVPGDCRDLGGIGRFMQQWVADEAELLALNVKESNADSFGADDEALRARLEGAFEASLKKLLGKASVTGLRVDFPGESRGPAIRVYMNPCLSNSFQGGLVVLL